MLVEQIGREEFDFVDDMRDALVRSRGAATHNSRYVISLLEKKLGEIGPVLASDSCNECGWHRWFLGGRCGILGLRRGRAANLVLRFGTITLLRRLTRRFRLQVSPPGEAFRDFLLESEGSRLVEDAAAQLLGQELLRDVCLWHRMGVLVPLVVPQIFH